MSLAYVDAPRDYLSLSLIPKRGGRRGVSGSSPHASSVASGDAAEGVLVVVEAVIPPAEIPAICLPPKKRKLAACGVYQETAGTVPSSSSSQCLALAIVNDHDDGVYRSCSSSPPGGAGGDGETRSLATTPSQPMDAVPLQCVHGDVSRRVRLTGGAREAMAPLEPAWIRQTLDLPDGAQLQFIAGKRIQCSDIDKRQNRLLLPRREIHDRLVPLLNADERRAAGLHEAFVERPKPQTTSNGERPRVQGKKHGGLVVPVIVVIMNRTGRRMDATMTRWESTGSTVLKFGDSKSFAYESGLRMDDVVEIWAFRQHGRLHLVIAKIDSERTSAAAVPGGQQQAA
jgi:hypothetical protein